VNVELLDPTRVADVDEGALADLQGRASQAVVSIGLALRKERERN
jgi:hypothetical protein